MTQPTGGAVAPTWFGPIQLQLNQMENHLNQMHNQMQLQTAKIDNMLLFSHNHQIAFGHITRENLHVPYKMVPGFASLPPIPTMAAPPGGVPAAIAAVFEAPPPLPGSGVIPPPEIRVSINIDVILTQAEIGYLARWYNNTFKIIAGDDHQAQWRKLLFFLCGL